jgi:hypothetical protein
VGLINGRLDKFEFVWERKIPLDVDEDFYDHGLKMSVMHKDVACLSALLSSAVCEFV